MGFLIACSSRIPPPIVVPATPGDESALAIPRDTEEEHILAKYKHHYEQFRHVDDSYSNLSIQQEARLSQDYANAREAFNYWLWFVTDSVKTQSELDRRVQISNPASIQRIAPTLGSTVPGQHRLYLRFAHLIRICVTCFTLPSPPSFRPAQLSLIPLVTTSSMLLAASSLTMRELLATN
jgi:hypothetical protein